jgi:hypothetical protein
MSMGAREVNKKKWSSRKIIHAAVAGNQKVSQSVMVKIYILDEIHSSSFVLLAHHTACWRLLFMASVYDPEDYFSISQRAHFSIAPMRAWSNKEMFSTHFV